MDSDRLFTSFTWPPPVSGSTFAADVPVNSPDGKHLTTTEVSMYVYQRLRSRQANNFCPGARSQSYTPSTPSITPQGARLPITNPNESHDQIPTHQHPSPQLRYLRVCSMPRGHPPDSRCERNDDNLHGHSTYNFWYVVLLVCFDWR